MLKIASKPSSRKAPWIARAIKLIDEIAEWSVAKGWEVTRENASLREDGANDCVFTALRIVTGPRSELHVEARTYDDSCSLGWVELNAYPAMARVQLRPKRGKWEIMTDSRVPLSEPFDKAMFYRLVRHMVG